MANYNYYQPGASLSGCPGTAMTGGWYVEGSDTPIQTSYKNPATGKPWSPAELGGIGSGSAPITGEAGMNTAGATGGNINPYTGQPFTTADLSGMGVATTQDFWNFYNQGQIQNGQYVGEAGVVGTGGWGDNPPTPYNVSPGGAGGVPTTPTTPGATPTFGAGAAAGIPTPQVTPAPAYEISPELQEKMDLYGDKLTDWVTSGGYGLDPETQSLMIQQQTDTLKAREQENIRVMKNNMERRGITNSGYVQAAQNQITSNTSVAIAGAIADVQIKSALMKMASFEKGMGAMAQYLGFLSEQSQLAYAPEFATWQAEQMATMQQWQGKMDIYKMEINQAYQTQNTILQGQIQSQLNNEQQQFNIELAEMEIEANQKIATAQGIGGIFGTILGFIFGK